MGRAASSAMADKTRSISKIEERMEGMSPSSFRYQTLEAAKKFKISWIELGRFLYTIHRDKLYKDWGYLTFEAYCAKEVGVRQNTAAKLLKSYFFLEREEPAFLKKQSLEEKKPSEIPAYESVNALRLAKDNDRIPEKAYAELRNEVLDENREEAEVKKKIRYLLKGSASPSGLSPEAVMKKLAAYLQQFKQNADTARVPKNVLKKIDELLEVLS